jgi:drug/metabolite transporter (DMT)-like permease
MIMLVGFQFFIELNFDTAFLLAVLSGILYAIYLLMVKKVLSTVDVLSFYDHQPNFFKYIFRNSLFTFRRTFFGFSNAGWLVLLIQAVVANFSMVIAWLCHNNTCAPQGIF